MYAQWLLCLFLVKQPLSPHAGWDLAQQLLRPRSIDVDSDGRVAFVSTAGFQRIGAQEALRHRFLRPAALHERNLRRSLGSASSSVDTTSVDESVDEVVGAGSGSRNRAGSGGRRAQAAEAAAASRNGRGGSGAASSSSSASGSRSGSGGSAASSSRGSSSSSGGWWGMGRKKQQPVEEEVEEEEAAALAPAAAAAGNSGLFKTATGLWRGLQDRLFDLEARMIKTTSETAKQTTKVQKLQEKVRCSQCVGFVGWLAGWFVCWPRFEMLVRCAHAHVAACVGMCLLSPPVS